MTRTPWKLLLITLAFSGLSACSKQTAEEKGKALADDKIGMVKGIGEALKENGKQAAQSVSEGLGNTGKGVTAGFEAVSAIAYKPGASIVANGLGITRMHWGNESADGHVINAYVTARQAAHGNLHILAFDNKHVELGRVAREIKRASDSAGYEDFTLDARTPKSSIAYLTLEYTPKSK